MRLCFVFVQSVSLLSLFVVWTLAAGKCEVSTEDGQQMCGPSMDSMFALMAGEEDGKNIATMCRVACRFE